MEQINVHDCIQFTNCEDVFFIHVPVHFFRSELTYSFSEADA